MTIVGAALDEVIAHARAAAPDECCGLLIGAGDRVEAAHRAANLEPSPSRFLLDPRDHFAAIHAARARRRQVLGIYHSHPGAPATPSARDLSEAAYPEYAYLIVSLRGEAPDIRLYRLVGGNFQELPFVSLP